MVVNSSALPEQVVADVLSSAFNSAGQRCSALRILCLQDDVADRMLAMLKGAMAELEVGDTRKLSVDVGPVITAEARDGINAHIEAMWGRGFAVTRAELPEEAAARGTFVAPALIEVNTVADVGREVFGPVLHVLRYRREGLDKLINSINAAGYGLTFGLHTRIDETIGRVVERIEAGNIYVNRNIIGATVGVQPFGGARLSGTGPKAGGPLYLARLVAETPHAALAGLEGSPSALRRAARLYRLAARLGSCRGSRTLRRPRLALAARGARRAHGSGRRAQRLCPPPPRQDRGAGDEPQRRAHRDRRHPRERQRCGGEPGRGKGVERAAGRTFPPHHDVALPPRGAALAGVLFEGGAEGLADAMRRLAVRPGPIVRLQALTPERLAAGEDFDLAQLTEEVSIATNTAAAGGNASLMAVG